MLPKEYQGMTWQDLIRKYIPDASDKLCEFILWEKTAFPVAGFETVERQIQEAAKEYKEGKNGRENEVQGPNADEGRNDD